MTLAAEWVKLSEDCYEHRFFGYRIWRRVHRGKQLFSLHRPPDPDEGEGMRLVETYSKFLFAVEAAKVLFAKRGNDHVDAAKTPPTSA